jgi:hypothetical protein
MGHVSTVRSCGEKHAPTKVRACSNEFVHGHWTLVAVYSDSVILLIIMDYRVLR